MRGMERRKERREALTVPAARAPPRPPAPQAAAGAPPVRQGSGEPCCTRRSRPRPLPCHASSSPRPPSHLFSLPQPQVTTMGAEGARCHVPLRPRAPPPGLLRRLASRRLLFPSLLEVFRHSVEEIDLSGNIAVDAEWLAYLGSFRYLRILKLADCKNVNHSAIWPLSGMSTLKELDLSRCSRISDAGIKHTVSIDSLEKLHLSGTGLTDNGVTLISALKMLTLLDLGGVHMTGPSGTAAQKRHRGRQCD